MLHFGIFYNKLIKILDHNPEPARQEVPDIPHRGKLVTIIM